MSPTDRYAPSPTSDLHVGNLRTALAGWLLTHSRGGQWLMRVEDLDTARVRAAGQTAKRQLEDLTRLGLTWDGPVVRQSERRERYADALHTLRERTFECFCTRRDLAAASAPHDDGYRPYPGTCLTLTRQQRDALRAERVPALRIRSDEARFSVDDEFAGRVSGDVDDFVLVTRNGDVAYNLAVVVDDVAQGVDHITRGADLLSSAPRQAWLTTLLGGTPARYAHIGLVTDAAGRRLAKRDGDHTMGDLLALGWSIPQVFALLAASLGLEGAHTTDEALALLADPPPEAFHSPVVWDAQDPAPTSRMSRT